MDDATKEVLRNKEIWFIPAAIVLAGAILAITVYGYRKQEVIVTTQGDVSLMRPLSPIDHILGNPKAPVVLVTYTDIDSSFSEAFQATMDQITTEYAPSGNFAWVYRHLPLLDKHQNAAKHAEAAECVASLSNEQNFWLFIRSLQAKTPEGGQFNPRDYEAIVESVGIDATAFKGCLASQKFQTRVSGDFANGLSAGAGGSPFSILLVSGKEPITIDGAVPYDGMKKIIDKALSEIIL